MASQLLAGRQLSDAMRLVREICSTGHRARQETKIKVRQPLSQAIVLLEPRYKQYVDWLMLDEISDMIRDELNVKQLIFRIR